MISIDAGDVVFHRFSRETWMVAYCRGGRLSPAGWPYSEARTADCLLVEKATPQERLNLLREFAKGKHDPRCIRARSTLRKEGESWE